MFWRGLRDCRTVVVLVGWLCFAGPVLDAQHHPPNEAQKKGDQRFLHLDGDPCTYQAWLDEDVRWIISDSELAAFKQLSNDVDRDMFIEQFWSRRDPTPDTFENEFKEEHYRRIAYANAHFGAGTPGWKSDRGRIYITLGPPDEIESHPSQPTADGAPGKQGPPASTRSKVVWRYLYLEGFGKNAVFEFVDTCACGDYRLVSEPPEKDAPPYVPFPDAKSALGSSRIFIGILRPPVVKFKNLEEVITHKIIVKRLPFDLATDFVKVTSCTVQVPATLQVRNRDLSFINRASGVRATINVYGRLTALTGRVVETFEGTLSVDLPSELAEARSGTSMYRTQVLLRPGRYRLDVVVQDVNGDRIGTWGQGIAVPELQ